MEYYDEYTCQAHELICLAAITFCPFPVVSWTIWEKTNAIFIWVACIVGMTSGPLTVFYLRTYELQQRNNLLTFTLLPSYFVQKPKGRGEVAPLFPRHP